ncbi:MAG: hypothetical protein NVS3B8_16740 [Chitinophagaceae bacterium]
MEHTIKINLPGGYASAGDLYEILLIAESAGVKEVRFGNRQQLYFNVGPDDLKDMELDMLRAEVKYEIDNDTYPNIVSSYVADMIFNQEGWLREGVYKDILDMLNFQPRLKINLVDNQQTFVPFFSGNINFIASASSNYWFMYVRLPKTGNVFCSPSLVYSDDIPAMIKTTEDIILGYKEPVFDQCNNIAERSFFKTLLKKSGAFYQPIAEEMKFPDFYLPYYEGFNKYNNKYWLGIYRRNELFPVDFLKEVCLLCIKIRIGQIYMTPWKSIIVKGIEQHDRNQWGYLLSKYRLNIRHAANELNWQVEDNCAEGLELKKELVREFEEADLRTFQLCFAIKTQPKTGLPGSVIIKKNSDGLFDVLHTRDFNPNSKDYVGYAHQIKRTELSGCLIGLCGEFYNRQISSRSFVAISETVEISQGQQKTEVYQCNNCLTRYDQQYGDDLNGVDKNVTFEGLADYKCPVCDGSKQEFSLIV